MKYSGIGGQAVMEGVMMRNGARYALAVRKSDHTIAVETHKTRDLSDSHPAGHCLLCGFSGNGNVHADAVRRVF